LTRWRRPPYDRFVSFADAATTRLEDIGFRSTAPRRAVLDAIAASRSPFTIEDLTATVPSVGRATVFRTIKLLQELDLVCRVPLGDGGVRYQASVGEHHHHLVCRNCGSLAEFSDAGMDTRIHEQARLRGFQLESHSLELYGLCGACASGPAV
jgi:Fur family ferric uptake transcriptional regulator